MRYWIVSMLMTLLLMPGPSSAQTKLPAKWEELTAGDFKEAVAKSQGTCLLPFGILEKQGPHFADRNRPARRAVRRGARGRGRIGHHFPRVLCGADF